MRPEHNTILTGTAPNYKQAVTASVASTNEVKVGANAGAGEPLPFLFTVETAFVGAGATLTPSLQCSSVAGSSYADVVTGAAIPVASLVAGYQFTLELPMAHAAYVRAYFAVADGPFSAGEINCALMKDIDSNRSH